MDRLAKLNTHLVPEKISGKSPNDVVICAAVRTPLTKAKRGGFKDTPPDVLLSAVFKGVI